LSSCSARHRSRLHIWILVIALVLFGAFSVFGFAATQSLLPRLVPQARLVPANARLDQTDAAAATLGPAIGGGLVGLLGAPVAITVDAISYLIDAALNASIRVDEPRPDPSNRSLRTEIGDGLRWTYRHRALGPLGALIAGLAVGLIGDRPTLIGAVIAFAAAALTAALSPLREAPGHNGVKVETAPPSPEDAYPA
jgi:MFS family permease